VRVSRAVFGVVAICLLAAVPAAAQTAPAPAPSEAPTTHDDALHGAAALARRAALIDALGGFAVTVRAGLETAVGGLNLAPAGDRQQQLAALNQAVSDTAAAAATLSADGVRPSLETPQAMGPLSPKDQAAVAAGRPISTPPATYLAVLDDLLNRDGHPPQAGRNSVPPPDPNAIHAGLVRLFTPPAPSPSPASPAPSPPTQLPAETASPIGYVAAGVGGLVVVIILGAILFWLWRSRRDVAVRAPAPPIEDLLEVSRRLTASRTIEEAQRATVREALSLVPASSAALVVRGPGGLTIAQEGKDSVLVPERLGEGLIGRAADTGQPIVQVSATEPAIRNLPVALAAVPLVGGGSVIAVLVLARAEHEPFTLAERGLLVALAPVAAAAIASAGHTTEAIEESLTDALTKVANRRRLEADLPAALGAADAGPISVVMLDVDRFKSINDMYGHPAGDEVLRSVAALLQGQSRPGERVYRYGGEEFVVVLPDTRLHGALEFAERTRAAVAELGIALPTGGKVGVTASFGVAEARGTSAEELVQRADDALYRAKEAGRDRVEASA